MQSITDRKWNYRVDHSGLFFTDMKGFKDHIVRIIKPNMDAKYQE